MELYWIICEKLSIYDYFNLKFYIMKMHKDGENMYTSINYVIKEHVNNIYRIISIARYEIIAENRDSKLGILWNVLNPLIYILTYWFVFGIGIRNNKPVNEIPYLHWMLAGLIVWFFMSKCIRKSANSIQSKVNILEKMKFPVSILPATIVVSEIVEHIIMIVLLYIFLIFQNFKPNINNLQIIYYLMCSMVFCISFGLVFSVLTILVKDIKKLIPAALRILMYITPILWTMENLPTWCQSIMKLNPIYYVVEGYRRSLFGVPSYSINLVDTIAFWGITIGLFIAGCVLMHRYRYKFVDMG